MSVTYKNVEEMVDAHFRNRGRHTMDILDSSKSRYSATLYYDGTWHYFIDDKPVSEVYWNTHRANCMESEEENTMSQVYEAVICKSNKKLEKKILFHSGAFVASCTEKAKWHAIQDYLDECTCLDFKPVALDKLEVLVRPFA